MKSCSTCKKIKSLECFGKDKRARDGLRSQCKECEKIYERTRDQNKKRAYFKKYRANNRDREKTRLKNWKESNPEKYNAYHKRTKIKRRCTTTDFDPDITLEELYNRAGGTCALCGRSCDYNDYVFRGSVFIAGNEYPSIDHIRPLSRGGSHTWANVQLVHRRCNSIKSNHY